MPLDVGKDCFPASNKCHNCERKISSHVKKETDPKEISRRCINCHLLTYCDQDCQLEHWIKVHKSHCRFLSGKSPFKNCEHNAATCARCIGQNHASPTQLKSENSPETVCNIEEVVIAMKKHLSQIFGFHGEGKNCDCSLEFACELPLPLGEMSGKYVEMGSIDAMLAHSLKIVNTMLIKAKKEEHKTALSQLWKDIIRERSQRWYDILVRGKPAIRAIKLLSDQVDSLQTVYDASNPWWKSLKFSFVMMVNTNDDFESKFNDSDSMEDPTFLKLKLLTDYHQSRLQNEAIVSFARTWPNLMMWPRLVNGSLSVRLPPFTRCQSCHAELFGEVAVSPYENNYKTLPFLLPDVGDDGALVACCPAAKNPNCRENFLSQNVEVRMRSDEGEWKELLKNRNLFKIESRACSFCLKSSLSTHRCSGCRAVQYCSTVCQTKDFEEFHMSVCKSWAKDKSRRILGKGKQKDYWKTVLGEK